MRACWIFSILLLPEKTQSDEISQYMCTSRSQVQVWISRRRADNNGLKYQNGGRIISKKCKNRGAELLHRSENSSGLIMRPRSQIQEKHLPRWTERRGGAAQRQRVGAERTFFSMKSVLISEQEDDELHSLAAPSFLNGPGIPFTEQTRRLQQKVHTRPDVKTSKRSG